MLLTAHRLFFAMPLAGAHRLHSDSRILAWSVFLHLILCLTKYKAVHYTSATLCGEHLAQQFMPKIQATTAKKPKISDIY